MEMGQNVAVIGSGIAGISAAHLLSQKHSVTLFESDSRIGGHTNTFVISHGPNAGLAVDTGFIVLNDRTYPLLHQLFDAWGVKVRSADMSFGYFDELSRFTYGSKNLNMLLASRKNLININFWRLIGGVLKFWKAFPRDLELGELKGVSLREYVDGEYSNSFIQHYLQPFASAIWSASGDCVLDLPAEHCARFFINHGMLSYTDSPQWQTVVGGSHTYLEAFEKNFPGTIRRGEPISSIRRSEVAVDIRTEGGESMTFDRVVIATHADQALGLLEDPSEEETRLLGAWRYSTNLTVLHTDSSFLPPVKRAVAAWNYRRFIGENSDLPVCVTYHMNTLQGFEASCDYCVTLNPRKPIHETSIVKEFTYHHPLFDEESYATQPLLPTLNACNRTWFCGSYFRWGFHEDAVRSSFAVAKDFGVVV